MKITFAKKKCWFKKKKKKRQVEKIKNLTFFNTVETHIRYEIYSCNLFLK